MRSQLLLLLTFHIQSEVSRHMTSNPPQLPVGKGTLSDDASHAS